MILKANDARDIAKEVLRSESIDKKIYKDIEQRAKLGYTSTTFYIEDIIKYGCGEEIISEIEKDLKENGYEVSRNIDTMDGFNYLYIFW